MEDGSVAMDMAKGEDWRVTREETELGIDRSIEKSSGGTENVFS